MVLIDVPEITKRPNQRSISLDDIYLTKFISPWARPNQWNAEVWRWWVFNEPISMICRETLIANILALDWEITPRDSSQREELKSVSEHYTQLLEHGGKYYDFDWTGLVEWIMADLQDLPFGGAAELGRKGDEPGGRVMWVKPLDGGTLYPTLNKDFPVIQYYQTYETVTFPAHAIARTYMSPRPEILREGWGLAPPEKIYFALQMLYRGDKYYADLLIDAPPAGILDLMDVEWDDALNWVKSLKDYFVGAPGAFKIPVLAEHTSEAKFIPFGKVPNDIMFDKITLKYAAIVASAYGMSLSDIGLQTTTSSGQTLAGSIRDEKKTKRTGFARAKKKIKYWIEGFLPRSLQFNFIDLDDELNVALGRARLATITALGAAIEKGMIDASEARLVLLGDGLMGTTNLPEEPPPDAKKMSKKLSETPERPGLLGRPEAASTGGQGEVRKMKSLSVEKSRYFDTNLKSIASDLTREIGLLLQQTKSEVSEDELYLVRSMVDSAIGSDEDTLISAIQAAWQGKRWLKLKSDGLAGELEEVLKSKAPELHGVDYNRLANDFTEYLDNKVKIFLGKSATYILKDLLLGEENVFDTVDSASDNNIVDKVYLALSRDFDEYVSACVNLEADNLVNKMIEEIKK